MIDVVLLLQAHEWMKDCYPDGVKSYDGPAIERGTISTIEVKHAFSYRISVR